MKARSSGLACLVLAVAACGGSDPEQRQTEVARVGGLVMPFDLERATHVFEKLERGGLQTVARESTPAWTRSTARMKARTSRPTSTTSS